MEIRFRGNLSRLELSKFSLTRKRQALFFLQWLHDSQNVTKVIIGQMSLFIAFIFISRVFLSFKPESYEKGDRMLLARINRTQFFRDSDERKLYWKLEHTIR